VGVRFTPSCLGGDCADGGRRLRVYVNGAAYQGDPTTLPLASHQELVVAFGSASQLPSPIPSTYQFPPGEQLRWWPRRRGWACRPVWASLDR
jgi:hypothetical protein